MIWYEIVFIALIVGGALVFGLYRLNRWAAKRMDMQNTLISQNRAVANIYVIDKKRDKVTNVNLPKAAVEAMPKATRMMKMYFVQAKVGAQIVTLMCEKKVFNALPVKKNVKVGLAGIYITDIPGMKTDEQLKAEKKAKKAAAKETK